jgi:SAM-dependent methyltransferase
VRWAAGVDDRDPLSDPMGDPFLDPLLSGEGRPNAARMYDYYLGGLHNTRADRDAADALMARLPDMEFIARANRAFLARAVRYLASVGIRQFVDLGSGLPTVGNVHEIAQGIDASARVVYVDNDPTSVAYAKDLLVGRHGTAAIREDLRDPGAVLRNTVLRELIDLRRPVGLLMCAVLHFVPDSDEPAGLVADYHRSLAPGSFLAISHGTGDARDPEQVQAGVDVYAQTSTPAVPRTRPQVAALLGGGWDPVPPGVVWAPQWRPLNEPGPAGDGGVGAGEGGEPPERSGLWVAVASWSEPAL